MSASVAVSSPAASDVSVTRSTVNDPNDTRGPLDIKRAQGVSSFASEYGDDRHIHFLIRIRTFGAWDPSMLALRGGSYFVIAFDRDARRRGLERLIYVFYARRHLRAVVADGSGRHPSEIHGGAWQQGRNLLLVDASAGIRAPRASWAVASVSGPGVCPSRCLDVAPNHGLESQDVARPIVKLLHPPGETFEYLTDISATTSAPVVMLARDEGGSHLARWALVRKLADEGQWTIEGEGDRPGRRTLDVTFQEGLNELRLEAVDGQGSRSVTQTYLCKVPYDDNSSALLSGYQGVWLLRTDNEDNYDGTIHESAVPGSTLAYAWTDQSDGQDSLVEVLWVGRGGDWEATIDVDGVHRDVHGSDHSPDYPRSKIFYEEFYTEETGPHSVVITVVSGTVPIDGLYVRQTFLD
jgi:hypothetical protein